MQTINYPCEHCYQYLSELQTPYINPPEIRLGYWSGSRQFVYLYFPINYIPSSANILKAELFFYPVREHPFTYSDQIHYTLTPLSQLPNPYQQYRTYHLLPSEQIEYIKNPNESLYSFDLSPLASKWVSHIVANYGFFLYIENIDFLQIHAGTRQPATSPFLSITFQTVNSSSPLHDDCVNLPVTLKILP